MKRRMYRVNEAIREVVSQEIKTRVSDPRIGFVTVTGVDTTPDLRQARVFVSVMGSDAQRTQTLEALDAMGGFLQAALAAQLVLKRTPRLAFVDDETIRQGMHITELIDREEAAIAERRQRGEKPEPDEDGPAGDAQGHGEERVP